MLRIDGRILAASVAGVFLVGAAIGFVAAGFGSGTPTTAGDPGTPVPDDPTPAPTPAPTATGTMTGTSTAAPSTGTAVARTGTGTETVPLTPTTTSLPTPTATPTATPAPTATPTRTPMLIRRFDAREIEDEIQRLLNRWRRERDLPQSRNQRGRLVRELDAMARNHSVDMADLGKTVHVIDNTSSVGRYRANDLYWNCRFKAAGEEYFVTPSENRLEVLGRSYAGIPYRTPDGTDYNANETAVARDVVDAWTSDAVFRHRLSYRNATRIGVGVELTRENEVYVTGTLCGGSLPEHPK